MQEVTRTVSITSSTIEIMEVDSEEYFITAIESGLSVLDYSNLYSIKVYVDGEEFYKILLMEAFYLLKDHGYIVKIPHLPPLTLRKDSILLKLLKQDFLSKGEQTLFHAHNPVHMSPCQKTRSKKTKAKKEIEEEVS